MRSSTLIRRALHLTLAALLAASAARPFASSPRFYDDDPLWVEPNTQDASTVAPWEIDLTWDLVETLFANPGDKSPDKRAVNVNTVDEVPNGAWFTNRAGSRPLTAEEVARGANESTGPAPGPWSVVSAKSDGITPGFTIRDRERTLWFIKFDPPGWRGMATGAEVVAARLLWALGYHTPEYYIARLRLEELTIAEGTRITPPGSRPRQMKVSDLAWLLRDADRDTDGSYRVIASKGLPGRLLGGFRFYDTRPDDPNDVFPHEHRRELRGYGVAAAWLNHVDAKSINTMDTLLEENGRGYVRHYLLDFGSTLGSAAVGPREYWEGREYLVEPGAVGPGILGFGFYRLGQRAAPTRTGPAIGRIDRDPGDWDPETWKPRTPNPAFVRARADDKFWGARKIAAITDDLLRAAVSAGQYGDAGAEEALVGLLRGRRDAIARRYLPAVNPVSDPALDAAGRLVFRNAAVDAGVATEATGYHAEWARFDNATGETEAIGETTGPPTGIPAPELPAEAGAFVRVAVRAAEGAPDAWTRPVHAFFRRAGGAWKLVGFERLP